MARPYPRLPGVQVGPLGERMIAFVEKYYPKINELYVTSAYRPEEGGSHHSGLSYGGSPTAAVDFGAYDDPAPNDQDQRDMGEMADWLYSNFWDLTVELIHTQPQNDHETYVRHQAKVSPYAVADHVNHIHWAVSAALMDRIEERARARWGDGVGSPAPSPSPAPSVTFGWDASNHDWGRGPMDLVAAKNDGIQFFTHKASEGLNNWYVDPYYKRALDRAKNAGIPVLGAYFVLHPGDAVRQAEQFFAKVDTDTPYWRTVPWIWQLDAEKFDYMDRAPNLEECNVFLDRLHTLSGGHGYFVAYAPKWLYGDTLCGLRYDLWASDYTGSGAARPYRQQWADVQASSNPKFAAYSCKEPLILQFSSDATIGTQPICDINKFRGSLNELITLAGGSTGEDMPFMDDQDAAALAWRVEAIASGSETVNGGPTSGEAMELIKRVNRLETKVDTLSTGGVDYAALAAAVADELSGRLADG